MCEGNRHATQMVCKVLYYIVPEISGEGIESCPEKWWAIVKFSKRKDCEHVIRIKKDFKNLNPTDINLLVGTIAYDSNKW